MDDRQSDDILFISKTGVTFISTICACSDFSFAQSTLSNHSSANQAALNSRAVKIERQTFVENSLLYIREHFKDKLTLDDVASKVFVNPKYFSHVFKREMGVSFTEYVSSLKIEFACKLLTTTSYHAYRISFECGFSDPSYFNRVFCAQMSMTPQSYRKYASSHRTGNKQDMA